MKRMISEELMEGFKQYLIEDEKSQATIEKYMRDLRYFASHAAGRPITKPAVLEYKKHLGESYAPASANSMLAALNAFFDYAGWKDCRVKRFKMQVQVFCPKERELTKEEYFRLVRTAARRGNTRLELIIETICGTGIRVSELQYITVEAAFRGEASVSCKGKSRRVFIVKALQQKLKKYIKRKNIVSGPIFITGSGRPIGRSSVWREMKSLCAEAGVPQEKVFPHNLRHLFAREFYAVEKDIAKLADLLGHASINTTRIYMITSGSEHRRRMEALHLVL